MVIRFQPVDLLLLHDRPFSFRDTGSPRQPQARLSGHGSGGVSESASSNGLRPVRIFLLKGWKIPECPLSPPALPALYLFWRKVPVLVLQQLDHELRIPLLLGLFQEGLDILQGKQAFVQEEVPQTPHPGPPDCALSGFQAVQQDGPGILRDSLASFEADYPGPQDGLLNGERKLAQGEPVRNQFDVPLQIQVFYHFRASHPGRPGKDRDLCRLREVLAHDSPGDSAEDQVKRALSPVWTVLLQEWREAVPSKIPQRSRQPDFLQLETAGESANPHNLCSLRVGQTQDLMR